MNGQYERVLPRDLFNESSLFFLYGHLWLRLYESKFQHDAEIAEESVSGFKIVQDESSGAISIENVNLFIKGKKYNLERGMNSREKWSFILSCKSDPDFNEIMVFDDEGELSEEMKDLIGARPY